MASGNKNFWLLSASQREMNSSRPQFSAGQLGFIVALNSLFGVAEIYHSACSTASREATEFRTFSSNISRSQASRFAEIPASHFKHFLLPSTNPGEMLVHLIFVPKYSNSWRTHSVMAVTANLESFQLKSCAKIIFKCLLTSMLGTFRLAAWCRGCRRESCVRKWS